jgi:GNAT superfamily N-acetyltransferase
MLQKDERHEERSGRMADPALVAAIEQASLWAWPPSETRYLHGWLLRAGGTGSRRVSSARTLAFDAAVPVERAIAEAAAWYEARDLPCAFQLTELASPADLDRRLEEQGYGLATPTLVMTAPLAGSIEGEDVELLHRPSQIVLNAMAEPGWTDALRRERAALLARIRRPFRLGLVTVGGEPAAGGLVVADGELAGLFGLRTQAPFRRQGMGRRLLRGLLAWAWAQGARQAYLQVKEANGSARALYGEEGFAPVYRYWYRVAPGA